MADAVVEPTAQLHHIAHNGLHWWEDLTKERDEEGAVQMARWADGCWLSMSGASLNPEALGLVYAGPVLAPAKRSSATDPLRMDAHADLLEILDDALSAQASRWLFHTPSLHERAQSALTTHREMRFAFK